MVYFFPKICRNNPILSGKLNNNFVIYIAKTNSDIRCDKQVSDQVKDISCRSLQEVGNS